MSDTRSKASKHGDRGKRSVQDPWGGQDKSPALSLGESLADRPSIAQFVTIERGGEAPRQVQEVIIQGMCLSLNLA